MAVGPNKSILDNFVVEDKAFPLRKPQSENDGTGPALEVVSSCPLCGAPVYGPKQVTVVGPPIQVQHTCGCRFGPKGLAAMTKGC